MPDQLLTQEEIDALLSAMDKGDVELEEKKKKNPKAVSYSLTAQKIILRDQFYALEEVYVIGAVKRKTTTLDENKQEGEMPPKTESRQLSELPTVFEEDTKK